MISRTYKGLVMQVMEYEEAKRILLHELSILVTQHRDIVRAKDEKQASTFVTALVADTTDNAPFASYTRTQLAAMISVAVNKLSEQEAELAQWHSVGVLNRAMPVTVEVCHESGTHAADPEEFTLYRDKHNLIYVPFLERGDGYCVVVRLNDDSCGEPILQDYENMAECNWTPNP